MFVVFGSRAKPTYTGNPSADVVCGFCRQPALGPFVTQRYAHVFWIPIFPLPKQVAFHCQHCKQTLDAREAGPAVAAAAKQLKWAVRTPFYMYIGAALIAAIVALTTFEHFKHSREQASWAEAPEVGDHYVIDLRKSSPTFSWKRWSGVTAPPSKTCSTKASSPMSNGIRSERY